MARSKYIYLVFQDGYSLPIAAFTVKHEAMSFIERQNKALEYAANKDEFVFKLYGGADGRAEGWTEIKLPD